MLPYATTGLAGLGLYFRNEDGPLTGMVAEVRRSQDWRDQGVQRVGGDRSGPRHTTRQHRVSVEGAIVYSMGVGACASFEIPICKYVS